MLTYWETLIATRSSITVNDSYAQLWGKKSQSGYTVETYTGTLPATLQTVAGYLESYKIYGNTVQDGTPTPENPIVPNGCGELETTGAHAGQYKLPILSNSAVTDIYLGESQTTRWIKKLVFDGTENWYSSHLPDSLFNINITDYIKNTNAIICRCTHFKAQKNITLWSQVQDKCVCFYDRAYELFYLRDSDFSTVDDFKSYLAAQYAAGTPVTVWYVFAEPETGIVNEPLMKIGDYADTIDSTQSTVQIPTAAGETTISWAGEGLAPSEVELVYKVKR